MMLLPLILLTPFAGALLCLLLANRGLPAKTPWVITMVSTAIGLFFLTQATLAWNADEPTRFFVSWVPELGLNFSLWLDGPALFFTWLVLALGFLIFLYAGFYMDPKDSPWRFFGTMLFFMGAMLGVVMSKNALLMFVFWELTSVSSFILIGHWHQKESARSGALRALVITGSGGLALLAGLGGAFYMLTAAGIPRAEALEWDTLWANSSILTTGAMALPVMVLVLLGAFTKSAQFPFHFWLPGAMEAPTPVSAFLHAATMVKAGIYLLGRLYPIYSNEIAWLAIVGTAGVLTMIVGGFMALTAYDLKQLLAHSTVSQLGLLTAYYGFGYKMIGTDKMLPVDLLLVGSHAFFKGGLFMLCGVIDHAAHTRDWRKLGGLRKDMPITCALVIIGCISMAGLPLTLGFTAKELFLKAAVGLKTDIALLAYGLPILAIFASVLTMAYCLRTAVTPFFGKPRDSHIHAHEGGFGLLFSPAVLILACLVGGLYTASAEGTIGKLVNASFYSQKTGFHWPIAFFEYIDKVTIIAIAISLAGIALFTQLHRVEAFYVKAKRPTVFLNAYETFFNEMIPRFATGLTQLIQKPSLSRQVTISAAVIFSGVTLAAIIAGLSFSWDFEFAAEEAVMLAVLVATIPCLWMALTHPVHIYKVISLAPIGLFIALVFVMYKAPDLALTQLFVEVAITLVLLMLLWKIPQRTKPVFTPGKHYGIIAVAVLGGLVMGALSYTMTMSELRDQPTYSNFPNTRDYYIQNTKYPPFKDTAEAVAVGYPGGESLRSGGGNNAVNVVLVDFRAFDTLGEIMVLGVAALGILCLLVVNRKERETQSRVTSIQSAVSRIKADPAVAKPLDEPVIKKPVWGSPSLLFAEVARIAPALLIIFATVLFWVGHNAPGGGFIAGLAVSIAIIILYIAFPSRSTQSIRRINYLNMIPVGMLLAIGIGLVAIALGSPFLTTGYDYYTLPFFGKFELATALVFDLGVFLLVVGTVMLAVEHFRRV